MGIKLLVKYEKFCIDFSSFYDSLPVLWRPVEQFILCQEQYWVASPANSYPELKTLTSVEPKPGTIVLGKLFITNSAFILRNTWIYHDAVFM